ncbi:hypothetical protein GSI_02851 [Ganoderma sinense ZZ0214-1]|uniref:Uncharacterized protein n=1 Tax=Ganoderma sinense ZZ0214-1 TaxID=1077348 RepID=A0A2G8SMS2_9APHY|nr:hypothetical protein GSI_02851 [Ganoderma sinense ZZ0214-1]
MAGISSCKKTLKEFVAIPAAQLFTLIVLLPVGLRRNPYFVRLLLALSPLRSQVQRYTPHGSHVDYNEDASWPQRDQSGVSVGIVALAYSAAPHVRGSSGPNDSQVHHQYLSSYTWLDMRKVAKKGTKTRKCTRTAKRARAAQTEATGASAPSDPSQWRVSRVRDSDTITRTNAKEQYHLRKKDDLEGIPYDTIPIVVRGNVKRSMYIYKERDVERKAWVKYGGPEGFEAHLAQRKEWYLKRYGPRVPCPQPRSYEDRSPGPVDPYVGRSPTLLRIKNKMVPWLWTAYNEALSLIDTMDEWSSQSMGFGHGSFTRDRDREGPMRDALVMAPTYPPRPAELLAPSPSVDKVRAVLADAATLPSRKDWGRESLPGLAAVLGYDGDGELASGTYRWSDDYLERLFTALIEVVEAHGPAAAGFEGIRWEVYDKCVDVLMAGPHYDEGRMIWTVDPAAQWLDCQLASLGDTDRSKCDSQVLQQSLQGPQSEQHSSHDQDEQQFAHTFPHAPAQQSLVGVGVGSGSEPEPEPEPSPEPSPELPQESKVVGFKPVLYSRQWSVTGTVPRHQKPPTATTHSDVEQLGQQPEHHVLQSAHGQSAQHSSQHDGGGAGAAHPPPLLPDILIVPELRVNTPNVCPLQSVQEPHCEQQFLQAPQSLQGHVPVVWQELELEPKRRHERTFTKARSK